MSSYNTFIGTGRLVKDPEEKRTGNDVICARVTVAFPRRGNEEVDYIQIRAYGKTAEFILKHFHKGKPIQVIGEVRVDKAEDKNSDKTNYINRIIKYMLF